MIRAVAMLALLWVLAPMPAAAETTECTQITAVPATISKQGVYCLKADLATNITSGNAITIATNNVTLDCNGFKLGGLGAGLTTRAHGIHADERMNITIRDCSIRGFFRGIVLDGSTASSGHRVLDNLLDGNTYLGMRVMGDGVHIRGNRVVNTGGTDNASGTYAGILVGGSSAYIADNDVSGVFTTTGGQTLKGFAIAGTHHVVEHNRVSNLIPVDNISVVGLYLIDGRTVISNNALMMVPGTRGWPLRIINEDTASICSGNVAMGFDLTWLAGLGTSPLSTCTDGGGNFAN